MIYSTRQKFTNTGAFAGAPYGKTALRFYPKKDTKCWPILMNLVSKKSNSLQLSAVLKSEFLLKEFKRSRNEHKFTNTARRGI